MRALFRFFAALVLAGCQATAPTQPAAPAAADPSLATLQVWRDADAAFGTRAADFRVDDVPVFSLQRGARSSIQLAPGTHTLRQAWPSDVSAAALTITLTVAAGEQRYFSLTTTSASASAAMGARQVQWVLREESEAVAQESMGTKVYTAPLVSRLPR